MIEKLQKNIDHITNEIAEYTEKLKISPDDFASQLTKSSLQSHLTDLINQKVEIMKIHEKEIVEIRLKGEVVNNGTVPLKLLSDITSHLALALQYAASKINYGFDKKRVPQAIKDLLNLRFLDLQLGSSRIFIEGNNSPDLFGNSLLESALQSTFKLLSKDTFEDVIEETDNLGIKSIKNLHNLFVDILKKNIDIELNWKSIDSQYYKWDADQHKLEAWKKIIEKIQSRKMPDIEVFGFISLMSSTGRIEILTEDNQKYKVTYPYTLHAKIREFHLDQKIKCVLTPYQIIDISKGIERIVYNLVNIEEVDDV